MGRIVKGAQVAKTAYQVKAPAARAVPEPPPFAFDDEPVFETPRIAPEAAMDSARAEAAKVVEDAAADAEALLHDARDRALQLIDDANARVLEIEGAAKNEGFAQGVSDARAAAQAEMDEMLETMRGLVEMARTERHKIIQSAEPEIVRLSVTICERILNAHLELQPNTVIEMVRSAIAKLVSRETVTVRVNPADIELMREHRDQLMAMNDIDNLRVIEDRRVDRGGVVLDTDAGTIDAKISTQLREARRLLAVEDPVSMLPAPAEPLLNVPAQAS